MAGVRGGEADAAPHTHAAGREAVLAKGWGSEQEGLFAAVRWQAQTHLRRTLGAFDG